ncbi:MAG TPA: transketolase C-terminal domain-containing protein, partial [Gemmatimonadaceae bacterium]|nr:transketolase C-terminal domain-containing protein [Gemmatimonadaceae bacterium]
FYVDPDALAAWRKMKDVGAAHQAKWEKKYATYQTAEPTLAKELDRRLRHEMLDGWEEAIPTFTAKDGNVASRAASGVVLNAIASKVPELIGGSADLSPSTNTIVKDAPSFEPNNYIGRNFHFGIREHTMGAIMNGMSLYDGIIPYGATFLIFSDYMRPAVRLAALMHRHVIYVYTHDSIGLGEDGPTHQPIEQLSTLRAIPNMTVIRPADANETAEAWRVALKHKDGPVALVLTRQKLPLIDRTKYAPAAGLAKGAYILADAPSGTPEVVLLSSGSEVTLVIEAQQRLLADGIQARAVSMPCMELFEQQDQSYQASVLPPGVKRVSIEAAAPMSWYRWIGSDGTALGLTHFGASAPGPTLFKEFGITTDHLVQAAKSLLGK